MSGLLVRAGRSFVTKIVVLLAIFLSVPVLVYEQFRAADEEKVDLILDGARDQGRLLARSLRPLLSEFNPSVAAKLAETLPEMTEGLGNTKVLFRPVAASGQVQFYYVAAVPKVPTDYLEAERAELAESGILDRVAESCAADWPIAARFTNPSGQEELLTSLTPVNTKAGCWVVLTSRATEGVLGATLRRPYWEAPEIRFAAAIYVVMALFVVLLFGDIWRSLRNFGGLAREIRTTGRPESSFAESSRVPELDPIAREFDRLTEKLHESADLIRHAAEENAHAFKTPIAVISQSLEPIRRTVGQADEPGGRAIERIEQSVARLDALVGAARRLDEASAELLDPRRTRIDLQSMLSGMCDSYTDSLPEDGPKINFTGDGRCIVLAGQELMETVFENVIENAISFSAPGMPIEITLTQSQGWAEVRVEDKGPGVPDERLDQIFERYYSHRAADRGDPSGEDHGLHFGIGLWVVRRNLESVGGTVRAENMDGGGFGMILRIPLA